MHPLVVSPICAARQRDRAGVCGAPTHRVDVEAVLPRRQAGDGASHRRAWSSETLE